MSQRCGVFFGIHRYVTVRPRIEEEVLEDKGQQDEYGELTKNEALRECWRQGEHTHSLALHHTVHVQARLIPHCNYLALNNRILLLSGCLAMGTNAVPMSVFYVLWSRQVLRCAVVHPLT